MVPFGLTQEQFLARYRRCLERGSPHLIANLRELIARPVPSTVKDAEVQIFFGEDGSSLPSAWIYYRGVNTKVDHADQSIFPGRSLELSVGLDSMEEFDESYFTEASLFDCPTANPLKFAPSGMSLALPSEFHASLVPS